MSASARRIVAPGPLDIASRTSSTLKLDGFCRGGMGQTGFQVKELRA
jgi:hypothetical protein